MDYQVWTKQGYSETWERKDCGDLAAVKRELDAAIRRGEDPILTQEVPYELGIKISPVGEEPPKQQSQTKRVLKLQEEAKGNEADQGEAGPDKGPGAESTSQV